MEMVEGSQRGWAYAPASVNHASIPPSRGSVSQGVFFSGGRAFSRLSSMLVMSLLEAYDLHDMEGRCEGLGAREERRHLS